MSNNLPGIFPHNAKVHLDILRPDHVIPLVYYSYGQPESKANSREIEIVDRYS